MYWIVTVLGELRVAKAKQAPIINCSVIKGLRERDELLKIARRTNDINDWANYKKARNKVVSILRRSKSEFYKCTFTKNKDNPRKMWKTTKLLIGTNKR